MVGSEWMVAPVLDPGADQVNVCLPAGCWVHLWTGKSYGSLDQGVTVTVSAPLGRPGVFYKEGSAVGEQFVANLKKPGALAVNDPRVPLVSRLERRKRERAGR